MKNIVSKFIYKWEGAYVYVNLHLLISRFIVLCMLGAIGPDIQVGIVTALNGDSFVFKLASAISLFLGFGVNLILTKVETLRTIRKYYRLLSVVACVLFVIVNLAGIYDISARFIGLAVSEAIFSNMLSCCISDTMNNMFSGSERTVYSMKKDNLRYVGAFLGMVLSFFIHFDLSTLLYIQCVMYIIMTLEDLFVFSKLKNYVFSEEEDKEVSLKQVA